MQRRTLMASALAALAAAVTLGAATAARAQTLVMWGPEQITEPLVAELWNGIKSDFEAANPGVTVEFMPPTGNISNGAVQAAIQSNAGPDVMLTNSGIARVTTVVDAALVAPLTAAYTERGWDKQIYPWLYKELKSQRGGEIYEVPDGLDALGIWYHKDMFAENGWAIPGTYADFLTLMGNIKEKGINPIAIGPRTAGSAGHLFGNILQASSGSPVVGEAIAGKLPWTDPSIALGAVRVRELVDAGFIDKDMAALDLDGAARLWFNKRAAMFVAGPWFTANARNAGYDLANAGFAAMPSDIGVAMPTGGVGWSWMIPANSRQPELAMKWIDFILSEEVMKRRAENLASTMLYPRAIKGYNPPTQILAEIFSAAAGGVGYNPSVYLPASVLDTYFQVIQGLISAQITGDEGMAQIQAKMAEAH
ncbi:ABC transporter substrate-binding protein [Mesorhizobium sp. L-8-3]|uniref:ABC transporter substrate-binding protein n=1 Tax=Mesorhizobium sp. L-8-3 TaxID=2744522 RepID=UPI0019373E63|nr:extracellular solute-binding protein [Mesorhizobium sp. L-8-3]BCH26505.1 ABC transporter substrate-binding protein [Mesorhizobium sp. L-8-3]